MTTKELKKNNPMSFTANHTIQSIVWLTQKYGWFITGSFVREHASTYLNDPVVPYEVARKNIVNGLWPFHRSNPKAYMIDLIMPKSDLARLNFDMKAMGLKVNTQQQHKVHENISYGDYNMETITLRVHWHDEEKQVRLADFEPILEFECDNLVILPNGKVTTMIPNNTVLNVLDQSKKRMTVVRRHDLKQTSKLSGLGWTIIDRQVTYVQRNTPSESCIICLEKFGQVHMKRSCCNAQYHCKCYTQVMNTSKHCPMCRSLMQGFSG
jgi:hypothetical protein